MGRTQAPKGTISYDFGQTVLDVTKIGENAENIRSDIDSVYQLDKRITDYYGDDLMGLGTQLSELSETQGTAKSWINELVNEIQTIDAQNAASLQTPKGVDSSFDSDSGSVSGADGVNQNGVNGNYNGNGANAYGADGVNQNDVDSNVDNNDANVNGADEVQTSPVDSATGGGSSGGGGGASPVNTPTTPTGYENTNANVQQINATDMSYITASDWSKLPADVQSAIKAKFKEVGYTDDEISDIINGKTGVHKVLVNAVDKALEELYKTKPEISDKLKEIYGFTPFNEDGTVDETKLKSILLIDAKNPDDEYDIVKLLKEEYGVSLVNESSFNYLKERLEKLISSNPSLREAIKEKYGFDVFNEDGTVNDSSLTLAMLMDNANGTDDFSLITLLSKYTTTSSGISYNQPQTPTATNTNANTNTSTKANNANNANNNSNSANNTGSKLKQETASPTVTPKSSSIGSGSASSSVGRGGYRGSGGSSEVGPETEVSSEPSTGMSDSTTSVINVMPTLISKKLPISSKEMKEIAQAVTKKGVGGSVAAGVVGAGLFGGTLTGIEKNKKKSEAIRKIYIDPSKWNSISKEEQEIIQTKLKEVGYSGEEIEQIIGGRIGVYEVLANAIQSILDGLMKTDATVEDTLKDIYEFSPFDMNGTIDITKIILLLLVDDKDIQDQYDIIPTLHDYYDIDLVDMNQHKELTELLKDAYQQDPLINQKLFKKYGIKILTDEGKVNYNNLILGILIDNKSTSDSYSIKSYITKEKEKIELSLIKKEKELGITKKTKQAKEKQKEENKEWLYGLGIGVDTKEIEA